MDRLLELLSVAGEDRRNGAALDRGADSLGRGVLRLQSGVREGSAELRGAVHGDRP